MTVAIAAAAFGAVAAEASSCAECPFEYRDGLIWLEVQVRESQAPLHFLLDSGAGVSVINLSTLRRIGRLRGRRVNVLGVEAAATGYWPQHLSVSEDGLPLPRDFLAVDLSELGRTCGRTVDGLVGADFFCGHAVRIDFASGKIRLAPRETPGTNGVSLPLEAHGGALRVPISVNHGPRQWVRLDTGCASALHWVSASVPPDECKPHVSVGLAPLSVALTRTSVQLGSLGFDGVRTGVHKEHILAGESGLLGTELLARFDSVVIDAPAGWLVLEGLPSGEGPVSRCLPESPPGGCSLVAPSQPRKGPVGRIAVRR